MKFIGYHSLEHNYKKENVFHLVNLDEQNNILGLHSFSNISWHLLINTNLRQFIIDNKKVKISDMDISLYDGKYQFILVNPVYQVDLMLERYPNKAETRINLADNSNNIKIMKDSSVSHLLDISCSMLTGPHEISGNTVTATRNVILDRNDTANSIKLFEGQIQQI